MTAVLPPIAVLAERLLLQVEQAVRGFPRYHKYALGAELRQQAREVVRLVQRAWRDAPRRRSWLDQLDWAIAEIKTSLQLGCQLRAFKSFAAFEALIRLVEDLGRQAGGWKRQQTPRGQNSTSCGSSGRAQTLSTRAASSQGANP